MSKRTDKYVRFLIQQNGVYYKVFRIQELTDGSIIEKLYKRNPTSEPSELGQWKVNGSGTSRIYYSENKYKEANFEHSTVHSSGVRHLKLKDGDYTHRTKGRPLVSLDHIKHLWTIIPGDIESYQGIKEIPNGSNFIINLPDGAIAGVFHLFAIPRDGNMNLELDMPPHDKERQMIFHVYRIVLDTCDVALFAYQSEGFSSQPPRTISIPNLEDFLPVVSVINSDYIEFELLRMTQSVTKSTP